MSNVEARNDQEIFELCEREDENQILSELAGRVSDRYVYEFPSADGPVTGLSYLGTNWACREFAKHGEVIRIVSKPEFAVDPVDPEHVIVSVVAQRFAVNQETGREIALDSRVGVKRQWTKMKKKDGSIVPNVFYIEHGVSKAQRNAMQALLPTDFVKKVVQQALAQKKNPAKPQAATSQPAKKPQGDSANPSTPPAGHPSAGSDVGAIRQRFWVVLKKTTQAKSDDEARISLKALAGVDKVSDLPEKVLKDLGNALAGVGKGTHTLRMPNGPKNACVMDSTGKVLFGTAEAAPAPPASPEPPAESEDGQMF